MDWKFHPLPQTQPIPAKTAPANVVNKTFGAPLKSSVAGIVWDYIKPGQNGNAYRSGYYMNTVKIHPDRPSPTLPKHCSGTARTMHWEERRSLTIEEAKILGSFPDDFILSGSFIQAWARIGNSVPPNLVKAIAENLKRSPMLENTPQPTVISTFAGCGGSSLGYHFAGFKELLAVEWDDNAAATFKLNFPSVPLYHGDIAKLSVEECMKLAGLTKIGELDVFDGSPPCQGFSTSGKRKYDDPRNSLFKEYTRLLKGLQPKCFVMENVTGMIKGHMKQAYLQIVAELRSCGYVVKGQVMNAMYYNVPQSRERVIIIGVRQDLAEQFDLEPSHPKPQTQPISIQAALQDIQHSISNHGKLPPVPSPLKQQRWAETKRGGHHHERFSLTRLDWNKPAGTIQKSTSGTAGAMHPDEPRELTELELKRIGSFPDSFQFAGKWQDVLARIGNSVPPNLVKAIAQHIHTEILMACKT